MAETKIDYLGRYGLGQSLDNPSSIIRRIRAEGVYTIEICNDVSSWKEKNGLMEYFWGLSDDAVPLTAEKATGIVTQWSKNWKV